MFMEVGSNLDPVCEEGAVVRIDLSEGTKFHGVNDL